MPPIMIRNHTLALVAALIPAVAVAQPHAPPAIPAITQLQANPSGGRTALGVMLGGELTDIMRVRRYLDGERGGW